MNLLTVVARIESKPGKEEETRRVLLGLVEPTRREEGCVQYDLHISTENPTEFVFFEKWADKDALDHHMQTPHFRAAAARVEELLTGAPDIRTFQRIA